MRLNASLWVSINCFFFFFFFFIIEDSFCGLVFVCHCTFFHFSPRKLGFLPKILFNHFCCVVIF